MNRQDLERAAKKNVCPCFFFELSNEIENTPDDDLRRIIENPMVVHYMQQLNQPVDVDEFIAELKDCPSYKSNKD